MGWVSDNVRKTRVTRDFGVFLGAPAPCKKNRPDAAEKWQNRCQFLAKRVKSGLLIQPKGNLTLTWCRLKRDAN